MLPVGAYKLSLLRFWLHAGDDEFIRLLPTGTSLLSTSAHLFPPLFIFLTGPFDFHRLSPPFRFFFQNVVVFFPWPAKEALAFPFF